MGLKVIDGTPTAISKYLRERENKEKGCRKELTPYTLCGDIGFNNKILLCDNCENNALVSGDEQ